MTELGVALLVVGAIAVLVEAHVPTLGVLGGPGAIALTVGAVLAVAGLGAGVAVAVLAALIVGGASAAAVVVSVHKGAAVRGRRIRSGPEDLIGRVGVARSWDDSAGKVQIDGALWRALRSWGEEEPEPIHAGDSVVVERLKGLTLVVRRAEEWELVA